ncbi:MAG: hypothetical protein HOP29_05155 [Phycisphaerales bacterium]|nr:hypothetical protein [Phycisphaerales bacterium]
MIQPSYRGLSQPAAPRDDRAALLTRQTQLQESVKTDAERAQFLENAMDDIDRQLRRLEGTSLAGILQSLTGSKHERIEQLKSQRWDHEKEHRDIARTFDGVSKQLDEIEHRLKAFASVAPPPELTTAPPDAPLAASTAQALASPTAPASDASPQDNRRRVQAAVDAAKTALQRIDSARKSFNRVRRKTIHGPAILASAFNAVQSQTTRPHVARVQEGLDQLVRRMLEIEARDDSYIDDQIARLGVELAAQSDQTTQGWAASADYSATVPVENLVREALNVLEEKLETLDRRIKASNNQPPK